ncbi:MAG: TlpA family protein disulfide reductase [Candidatus Eisenbacteria bacterium]|uniref:TlpA family protein disulfide reductase n=1 Tax=Eiseniibacteriota bacterium TaxID=2212470 RepID=A0A933W268_UNCEI|nr:TlpA family protein disulfide reductase [Candidatus Eisenbacteria bacterium]
MRLRYAAVLTFALAALAATLAFAQTAPAPAAPAAPATAPAAPAPPASPVSAIRNKISAGDLLSAESLAEVWRTQHGPDGAWLVGFSWLARGAQLLGEPAKARLYADSTLWYCDQRLAGGAKLADDGDLEYALGSAIEVKAQLLGPAKGAEFVRAQLVRFADSPKGFRSRLHKRLAMLTWTGKSAPELRAEDQVRGASTTLASLRGKPVVVYVYSSTCGDCRASAPTLARVRAKWEARGVQWVALTRWYSDDAGRERERTVVDSTWTATYSGMGDTPVVVSTASMIEYGGSSTPTFVFIDRKGVVRGYTPTRLTEAEFDRAIEQIAR